MHHVLHDDTTPVYANGVRAEGIGASAWQVARRHVQFVPQWWINRCVRNYVAIVSSFHIESSGLLQDRYCKVFIQPFTAAYGYISMSSAVGPTVGGASLFFPTVT